MCLYVYLVTDSSLPELPWDKEHAAFNVYRMERKEGFLRNFAGANAYILGSHEGCGCGFLSDGLEPKELVASDASRQALSDHVEEVIRGEGAIFLLAAWDGDESKTPVGATVTSRELAAYPWDQTREAPHILQVTPASGSASKRS